IHLAMEHLVPANRVVAGKQETTPANHRAGSPREAPGAGTVTAAGKHVIIIGGGGTAPDRPGGAHRQGAARVTPPDIYPRPAPAPGPGRGAGSVADLAVDPARVPGPRGGR